MGKAAGVSKRRRKNKNPNLQSRKKLRKQKQKLTKKVKLNQIDNEVIKKAWDTSKSVRKNFADMGLAVDPNKAIKVSSNTSGEKVEKMNLG